MSLENNPITSHHHVVYHKPSLPLENDKGNETEQKVYVAFKESHFFSSLTALSDQATSMGLPTIFDSESDSPRPSTPSSPSTTPPTSRSPSPSFSPTPSRSYLSPSPSSSPSISRSSSPSPPSPSSSPLISPSFSPIPSRSSSPTILSSRTITPIASGKTQALEDPRLHKLKNLEDRELANTFKRTYSKTLPRIGPKSGNSSLVILWRGTNVDKLITMVKNKSAGKLPANNKTTAPSEKEAIDQVAEIASMPEFTSNPRIAESFGRRGCIVAFEIDTKYLTKGSGTEDGFVCKEDAPVTMLAWKEGAESVSAGVNLCSKRLSGFIF